MIGPTDRPLKIGILPKSNDDCVARKLMCGSLCEFNLHIVCPIMHSLFAMFLLSIRLFYRFI